MCDSVTEEMRSLKNIESKLEELLKWTRIATKQQIRPLISKNLETDMETAIYELSDGSRSTRDIAQILGKVSHVTVSRYWKKWAHLSIVEPSPTYQGRYKKICSLEEVGISVPPIIQNLQFIDNEKE